jgi:anti-sigma regulatory factor (Ser/Thr protein kinase)
MTGTAAQIDSRLIALVLPSIPESVPTARSRVRAALSLHGLGEYADDAAAITSELVTNAVQHACGDGTVGITLSRVRNLDAVTVAVSDSSPDGPDMREAPADGERGRGLQIVEALSAAWGWRPEEGGKTVFAVLTKQADV